MASSRKNSGGGERIIEGRHVIGLFVLMLLFSAVFFALGYVMGHGQYEGQVRAADGLGKSTNSGIASRSASRSDSKSEFKPKLPGKPDAAADAAAPPSSDWEFYHAGDANKVNDRLKPAAVATKAAAPAAAPPKPAAVSAKANGSLKPPAIPGGAYVLQVAALTRESDALGLAATLQQKKFPAFVATPGADKFYRVQVGPFADAQSAAAAKKGLENAGFKAIVKH
ncbi:MAG TPA: SPOR domain-containing protein [Candidatus Acidoferrales bacterium]|nr:SPOR domain-containing protein [Candidatus Acidoferrales bacterium]